MFFRRNLFFVKHKKDCVLYYLWCVFTVFDVSLLQMFEWFQFIWQIGRVDFAYVSHVAIIMFTKCLLYLLKLKLVFFGKCGKICIINLYHLCHGKYSNKIIHNSKPKNSHLFSDGLTIKPKPVNSMTGLHLRLVLKLGIVF